MNCAKFSWEQGTGETSDGQDVLGSDGVGCAWYMYDMHGPCLQVLQRRFPLDDLVFLMNAFTRPYFFNSDQKYSHWNFQCVKIC